MDDIRIRREAALAAYGELGEERPELFANPPGAAFEIVLDRPTQDAIADEVARHSIAAGLPGSCGDIGVVYRDPYLMVVRDAVRFRSGQLGTYIRLLPDRVAPGAAVLPVLDDGRIVLINHFRHADRSRHWEIPRGFGDPDDASGEVTAAREIQEELGCSAAELLWLGAINPDSGMSGGQDVIHLARIAAGALPADLPAGGTEEGIDQIRIVTPDEFRTMILKGEITDAYTLAAYAYALARDLLPT
ncbi:NUDIX hydrolase [Embleya scabrispora]|uniref:NUDIX hydrolase n=1 Tax=Embleya scabrispora TaxID=159449 RepID=UPI0003631484|nr:NUDIX hydrolase [Embleya scabrispora]MYS86269.1 NUDIX domain-containing protein [Streptomyces sp. SID5474]